MAGPAAYVARQTATLLHWFLHWQGWPGKAPAAVRDLGALTRLGGSLTTTVQVPGPLPRARSGNAYVVRLDGFPTLWVRPAYSGYRGAFTRFLAEYHGVTDVGPAGVYDADHAFNKDRAIDFGLGYVLMLLVDGPANQAWGRSIEKRFGNRFVSRGRDAPALSIAILAKCLGVHPPASDDGPAVTACIDAMMARLARLNVPEHDLALLRDELRTWFLKAYRPPGKGFGEIAWAF